jgi:hypothetical protein
MHEENQKIYQEYQKANEEGQKKYKEHLKLKAV